MESYEARVDDANGIIDAVDDSDDPKAIAAAFERASTLLSDRACEQGASALADRLRLDAMAMQSRGQRRLRDLALKHGDVDTADAHDAKAQTIRRDTVAAARRAIGSGRTSDELSYSPDVVEAISDEDQADYLLARYRSDSGALQEHAHAIEFKARSAIERYKQHGDFRQAGNAYLTLMDLYESTGDIDRNMAAGLKAAECWEHVVESDSEAERSEHLRDALRLRSSLYLGRLLYAYTRVDFDGTDETLALLAATAEQWLACAQDAGDAEDISSARLTAALVTVFRLLSLAQRRLQRGDRDSANTALAEAKEAIAPFEDMADETNVRVARTLIARIEVQQDAVGAMSAGVTGDWELARTLFARALHHLSLRRSLGETGVGIDMQEAGVLTLQAFFEGLRLSAQYEFEEAEKTLSAVPAVIEQLVASTAQLSDYDRKLAAGELIALDAFRALANAYGLFSSAMYRAYKGQRGDAIAKLDAALEIYPQVRALIVQIAVAHPVLQLCKSHEEANLRLRHFLETLQNDSPRIRLVLLAKDEVTIGQPVDVTVKVQNDSDAPTALTCTVDVPADAKIRRSFGLTQDGTRLAWSGVLAARETREHSVTVVLPEQVGPYYFRARSEWPEGAEEAAAGVNVIAPVFRKNLGFMRVSLSEPQVNVLKAVGWLATLVAGGVVGKLL